MTAHRLHRLSVLAILVALAAQTALPAVHSRAVLRRSHAAVEPARVQPAPGPVLSRAVPAEALHDRDGCPICQILVHASPAALSPVEFEPPTALEVVEVAPAPRLRDGLLHTGHPPRAPPLGLLSSLV